MRTTRTAVLALTALLTAGCLGLGGGEPEPDRLYDMLPPGPPPPAAPGGPVVELAPFTIDPALDRDELVWRRGAIETGAYVRHLWARPPQTALRDLLGWSLQRGLDGVRVVTDLGADDADLELLGHVARCEEVDEDGAWTGVVELQLALVRRADGAVLLRRTYAAREPADPRNPLGVVEALRRGALGIGAELARDVGRTLRTTSKGPRSGAREARANGEE